MSTMWQPFSPTPVSPTRNAPSAILLDEALSRAVIIASERELNRHLSLPEIPCVVERLIGWIDRQERELAADAVPLRSSPIFNSQTMLASYFPKQFIDESSLVVLNTPIPAITRADLGVERLERFQLADGETYGLALRSQCVLARGARNATLAHELAHLVQLRLVGDYAYGIAFLAACVAGRYLSSPFESSARIIEATMFHIGVGNKDACQKIRGILRAAYGVT